MSKKRHEEEEHENHERWLVSYADMMTLLMVLFIVMFAMSQVDQKKFNMLKEGLAAGFGQPTSILQGAQSILDEPGTSNMEAVGATNLATDSSTSNSTAVSAEVSKQVEQVEARAAGRRTASAETEVKRLKGIEAEVTKALKAKGLQDDVRTTLTDQGLVISLVSRHVVFEPNIATLSPRGREVVDTLAPVLASLKDPLSIDGSTNQAKGKPKYFASNWELSAARAVGVLRYLHTLGIANGRMSATAYGDEKPLVDPTKPGSQRINKRVDIVVDSTLDPETRAAMAQVIKEQQATSGETP
ncbi:flagellar motor protein MotB [Nocardioides mangrovicus]|uniref:Flagellar motor protein MotB n=1 Tax=Nocardioides mangrovicus TaxID=2478913 RepID=A0A3L8P3L7_9ACTN|nr:flagellar motor protein MotB [Nocardioides mangrovicus]RLV49383.1 flagellar motor protein MotB [Nocardioides mangrovicus]